VEIDHHAIGNGKMGPVTQKLQETYFGIVRGKDPKYTDWLTPVYA
jgi:branched-chain amino acid aminotransferase